jgi:GGDEF domain-containing protein
MSIIQKLFGRSDEAESLHGEMYRLDIVEGLLRDALRAYQGLIDVVLLHVPKAAREIGIEHKKRLKQIRNLVDSKPSQPLIVDVRQQLDSVVVKFASDLNHQLGLQEKEARHVMAIVAVMAESMADREKQYNVRFRGIGKKLRVLTTSDDLAEIRRKLEAEVAQLEKYVEEMARDTESAVSRVRMELRQAKPEPPAVAAAPERSSEIHALPLMGRREAENAIDSRRRHDLRFCAARFSIDNMFAVTAEYGLPAAAGLMEQVGVGIRRKFEELDLVCRWSDNDLIVITDLGLPEVAMRVADLEAVLAGPYSSGSREVKLTLRTCVIERMRGELTQETVGRIDSMIAPSLAKK